MITILSLVPVFSLVPILSLVTSAKDYFEVIHKLMEFHPTYSATDYTEFGSFISYAVLTLKSFIIEILSFNWLQNIWSLPIIVPDIASAMISEISVLDGYFHNAFTFLETPLSFGKENYSFYGLEKFTIGFINSFFLFLPTSAAHVIFFRRLVFQGIEGGYVAGIGIIAGNILWLTSIIFGWRFFVIPWLSLDILRYLLGFVILIKFMWHASRDKRILTNFSKSKIFFVNFLLAFTEQTNLYPFVTNMSVGAESSILETFPVDNFGQFIFVHSAYIVGLLAGSISLLNFTCWLWENPIAKLYNWLKSNIYMPNVFQYKNLNFFFLYLTMLCTISSFPYFGLDYTLTNPLGLVSDDRILYQKNKKTGKTEYPEMFFLNSQASDKNARNERGRRGRRERWKTKLIKYKGMDNSLYNQGVYDLFTIEDLNYGFDKFWLRKKLRIHSSHFRMLAFKPQLLALKNQLAKPRLLTNEGARAEGFRMIYELFYHPNFHAYSRKTNLVSPRQNDFSSGASEEQKKLVRSASNKKKEITPLPSEEPKEGLFLKPLIKNNLENVNTFSVLRKFIRKINTRIKSSEILLDKNNFKSLNKPIYSKRWKQLLSQTPALNQNIQDRVIWEKINPALLIHSKNLKMPINDLKETWEKTSSYDSKAKSFLSKDPFNHLSLSAINNMQKEKLSKKDRQILRYKTKLALFLPLTTKIVPSLLSPAGGQRGASPYFLRKPQKQLGLAGSSIEVNNAKTMLHPIKFYLQKEKAFRRKFKFYGSSVFRKLSIENNAPYFRIMMKRLFYYYKPTLRWTKTFKLAKNVQGHKVRKKQSRSPLKLTESQYSSFSSGREANLERSPTELGSSSYSSKKPQEDDERSYNTKENSNLLLLKKPTHHYRIAGKNSSRHRNLIFKQALFNWYYTPFNRILSKLDIDSFIRRQPNSHFLTKKDEQGLHLKRYLLADHYETLRWYTYMQHYRSMKTKIGGTKSFASKFVYNQQFQGTLKKVRHLFAITPSLFTNKELAISSDSPFDFFGLSKPKTRRETSYNNSNFETKNILKFDQPLYNEYSNSKKNSLLNDSVTHEELLSPSRLDKKENSSSSIRSASSSIASLPPRWPGLLPSDSKAIEPLFAQQGEQQGEQQRQGKGQQVDGDGAYQTDTEEEDGDGFGKETGLALLTKNPYIGYKENLTRKKEDFIALSTSIVREYLKTARPIRQATIKEYLLKKNYKELTKFILTGQKIRGIKAITNQRLLINQERFYLYPNSESFLATSSVATKGKDKGFTESAMSPVLSNNSVNNTQLIEFFKKTANNLNIEQDMWFSLLKTYKKGLYDKKFIAKFVERRINKREQRRQNKEFELGIRLKRLQKWLSSNQSQEDPALSLFLSTSEEEDLNSTFTKEPASLSLNTLVKENGLLTTGLKNAIKESVSKEKYVETSFEKNNFYSGQTEQIFSQLKEKDSIFQTPTENKTLFNSTKNLLLSGFIKTKIVSHVLKNKIQEILNLIVKEPVLFLKLKPITKKTIRSWYFKNNMLQKKSGSRKPYYPKEGSGRNFSKNDYKGVIKKRLLGTATRFINSEEAQAQARIKRRKARQEEQGAFARIRRAELVEKNISKRQKNISNTDVIGTGDLKKEKNKTSGSFLYFNNLFKMRENNGIKKKTNNRLNLSIDRPRQALKHMKYKQYKNLERKKANLVLEKRLETLKETFISNKIKSKKTNRKLWRILNKNSYYSMHYGNMTNNYLKSKKARRVQKAIKDLNPNPNIDAYGIFKTRALTKQIKRIQLNLKLQQWWWLAFGQPNLQATAEAKWQFKKNRYFGELIAKLSKTEVLERDIINSKNSVISLSDSDSIKKALSLQIGDYDFKPLAIPQALRIRDNLIHQNFLLKKVFHSNSLVAPSPNKESSTPLLAFFGMQNSSAVASPPGERQQEELLVPENGRALLDKKSLALVKAPNTTNLINRLYINIFDLPITTESEGGLSNLSGLIRRNMVPQKKGSYSQLTRSVNIKILPEKLYSNPLLSFLMKNRSPLEKIRIRRADNIPTSLIGLYSDDGKKNTQFQNQDEVKADMQEVKPESKFFINTNPLPFYAGWDESLRKFVVTNRLLSRRDAGYSATFLSANSNLGKNLATSSVASEKQGVRQFEFTNAPLQGMNAGTTLYSQVPFLTFDTDQLFARGMDVFAPIGWRRFEFTHTIFKTKALTKWLGKKIGVRSIKPLLIKNISRKEIQPDSSSLISKMEKRGAKLSASDSEFGVLQNIGSLSERRTAEFYKMNYDTIKRSNHYSRRLQKKEVRRRRRLPNQSIQGRRLMVDYTNTPHLLISGPLIHQVLPVNYIRIFNNQNRFAKDRYIKRHLRRDTKEKPIVVPKTVKEFNAFSSSLHRSPSSEEELKETQAFHSSQTQKSIFTGEVPNPNPNQNNQEIFDFTFRRRLKTRRKYHRKSVFPKGIEVRPRRHKFLADLEETQAQNQNQQELSKKLMRKRPTKRRSKRKDTNSKIKTNSAFNQRLRQLRRRIFRQVIKTEPRRRPRAGGFVWPGDYLRLETTVSPKLELTNKNEKSKIRNYSPLKGNKEEASLEKTTLISNKQKINRKIAKKAILLDLYVQPRKYLLEKHNIKILKKKLEKAQRTNQVKQRVHELRS